MKEKEPCYEKKEKRVIKDVPQRKRDTSANPFSAELWSVLLNPPLIRVRVQCSASRQWRKESVWDEWLHNKYRGYSGGLVQHQQRWRFRPVVQTWRCLLRGLRLPATSRHQHPGLPSQQDYRSPPGNRLVRAEVMVEKGNAHGPRGLLESFELGKWLPYRFFLKIRIVCRGLFQFKFFSVLL